jgi:hypothetical protein
MPIFRIQFGLVVTYAMIVWLLLTRRPEAHRA